MEEHISSGHRIRQLRIKRGWTQDELADRTGTTKATVSKIERSTMKLSEAWLERFAAAFDATMSELLGEQIGDVIRHVPLVGTISAGNWREAVQDTTEWIPAVGASKDAFALTPSGDSMNLLIPDGAKVVVEPNEQDLRDGRIYCVMNGSNETTVKMYRAEPARLEPRSTNPEHQPILLGREPFSVIGRVTLIMQSV